MTERSPAGNVPSFDSFTASYLSETDGILEDHRRRAVRGLSEIFGKADGRLITLGKKTSPDHIWRPVNYAQPKSYSEVEAALKRFAVDMGDSRRTMHSYRFRPGEIGTMPEGLEVGKNYRLQGFATTEAVCAGLSLPHMALQDEGYVEINPWDVTVLDGEQYVFDGELKYACDICQNCAPSKYLSFSKVLPSRRQEMDEYFIPIRYATLPAMITVVE